MTWCLYDSGRNELKCIVIKRDEQFEVKEVTYEYEQGAKVTAWQ